MHGQMFVAKAAPKAEPSPPKTLALPVAATRDIDAALQAAKRSDTSKEQLLADSAAVVAGWKAQYGFHKHVHGAPRHPPLIELSSTSTSYRP
jgi:hypothetical protein